jgi:hypothetical protein
MPSSAIEQAKTILEEIHEIPITPKQPDKILLNAVFIIISTF